MGRKSVEYYRLSKRELVFSHEELVCKMAADPDNLDLKIAAGTYQDMLAIVETEKKLRKKLLDRVSVVFIYIYIYILTKIVYVKADVIYIQ